jgi:TIR domain
MSAESIRPAIFISYSHKDEPEHPRGEEIQWLSFVLSYLKPAVKHGIFNYWVDRHMTGGADWDEAIASNLRTCDIFILLVSANSMASDYIVDKEIAIIRERQSKGEDVWFYPLLLTPTPDAGLDKVRKKNLRPRDGQPFSGYSHHDRLRHMTEAANEIAKIAQEIVERKGAKKATAASKAQANVHVAGTPGDTAGVPENSTPKPSNILLVKGPPKPPERCKIRGLAAVELFPAQVGRGTADIGFDLSCGLARIFGRTVTIRIGELTWDCGGGQLDPETRKGQGAPYPASTGVKLSWNGADTFRPAWRVEAEAASIGNLAVPPDFGTVIGLLPGCAITATFGVWRPDFEEAEGVDTNAVIAAFDDITIPVDDDPPEMSLVKKRIITRLATAAIEAEGDFIVLCRHTVTFVAPSTE